MIDGIHVRYIVGCEKILLEIVMSDGATALKEVAQEELGGLFRLFCLIICYLLILITNHTVGLNELLFRAMTELTRFSRDVHIFIYWSLAHLL